MFSYKENTMENKESVFGHDCPHCIGVCDRITARSQEDRKALSNRLNRIVGQINGINRMLQENTYPPKILVQVSAASAALNSFSKELFKDFVSSCVAEHLKTGDTEVLDDMTETLKKML